jgi:mono/diheme cytochrome c family protein
MHRRTACALALLLAASLGCGSDGTGGEAREARGPGSASAILAERGRELFARYCAACHGVAARGDGPAAPALSRPPADLTAIAARRGGRFPDAEIGGWIDGRFESPAHGTREMPVWGVQLRSELPPSGLEEEIVRGQIEMLVEYLRSIQRPAP